MCSRYRLGKDGFTIEIDGIQITIAVTARYNVAPNQKAAVIIRTSSGDLKQQDMTWGWKPSWSDKLLINGQSESIEEKPTFRKYIQQRCLIPADGFYEWTADKTPIMFTKGRESVFCFGGLYLQTTRQPEDFPIVESKFIVLTTKPNKTVSRFHNRMPFIVKREHYGWWLDGAPKSELWRSSINFPDNSELMFCPVQKALNNVQNEGTELVRPSIQRQGTLF